MRKMILSRAVLSLTATLALFAAGCGQPQGDADQGEARADGGRSTADDHDHEAAHDHEIAAADQHNLHGWWCTEHGVPEGECTRCDAGLIAAFKEKGDWCAEHKRPDSQCFICHPEHKEKFAKRFEAKFGKRPPEPEDG